MKFEIAILGSGAATPTFERNTTSQVVNCNDKMFLIDCGEGTQMQMQKFDVKYMRIKHVFISHLHGDHYLGLMPLIFTMHLFGRKDTLHIYANKTLKDIIDLQLEASATHLLFKLDFHELKEGISDEIYNDDLLTVRCFPLKHRIPTHGFIFNMQPKVRKFLNHKINELKIPLDLIPSIKAGANFVNESGIVYKNEELTSPPEAAKKFAYCSDTGYCEDLIPYITGVDVLYHETTFDRSLTQNAREKEHSTGEDAAKIALKAKVKKLITGHYSARFEDVSGLIDEARKIFEATEASYDGMIIKL